MKKRVFGRKFSRDRGARTALFRSLVTSFIKQGEIKTTLPRAKAVRGLIDKLVTLARKNTLASRRRILKTLAQDEAATFKLIEEAGKRFADLSSGFTKMVRLGRRLGDDAPMIKLMWSRERKDEHLSTKSKRD